MSSFIVARGAGSRLARLVLWLLLGVAACKSDRSTPVPGTSGDVIFWNSQSAVSSAIQVTISGQGTQSIAYTVASAPACGDSRGASFSGLPAGRYTYSASATGFSVATGTVEVKNGTCTAEQVTLVASGTGGGGGTSGTSTIMFWTDQSRGTITVRMAGQVAQITGSSTTAPTCGDPYTALFVNLAAGTYSFTASSTTGDTWSSVVTVGANQCFKEQLLYSTTGGGTGGGTGTAMFWSDQSLGTVNVTLNGTTRSFAGTYAAVPTCGASGTATFSGLAAGTYPFTASGGGQTWSSNITIAANQCTAQRLYSTATGGGGTTTGSLTFWTASDHRCGNIAVTVNGATQNIANYYSSGTPSCGASGTATFTLAPGSYSYSCSCTGLTWNGTATVTAAGCTRIQLL